MDALLFHPKVVHIPIALAVLMPLVTGGLLLAWWRGWLPRRAWLIAVALQAILVGSSVVALRTGEADEQRVERVAPEQVIEAHERAAEAFVWVSGGALVLMAGALALRGRRSSLSIAAAAALAAFAVLGLGYRTGQAGGSLVFEHGAAQVYTAGPSGASGVLTPNEAESRASVVAAAGPGDDDEDEDENQGRPERASDDGDAHEHEDD